MSTLLESFLIAQKTLNAFIEDKENIEHVEKLSVDLAKCFENGGKSIIFGNGGSACDAAHFAEEFTGRFRGDRKALPVIAYNDASHITCVANDYGFEDIFARPTEAFCKEGDVVIGLSTSGNSANVTNAMLGFYYCNISLEIDVKLITV